MSVMHFAHALVREIIGPAMAGPTGPCATPMLSGVQGLRVMLINARNACNARKLSKVLPPSMLRTEKGSAITGTNPYC